MAMVKIQEVKQKLGNNPGSRYFITLPTWVLQAQDLKKGDEVNYKLDGGRIYLEFEKK